MPTDISLQRGAIVGLAGLLGSGRTELARLLYGADKADSGTVTLRGKKTTLGSPVTALDHRIAFSTENRGREGIIGDLTVRENLVLAVQAKRGWMRPLPRKEQDRIVAKYINELGVRPTDPERLIKNLSGGNQQKVLLARMLCLHPKVLILDEPTRGIDVGAKSEIQALIDELAGLGLGVLLISSELEEVVEGADRVLVLRDGAVVGTFRGDEVSEDRIMRTIAVASDDAAAGAAKDDDA
jgi:simple sugar transport system ATP-binding protein